MESKECAMQGMDYIMVSLLVFLYTSIFVTLKHIVVLSEKIEKEYCDAIFSTISQK